MAGLARALQAAALVLPFLFPAVAPAASRAELIRPGIAAVPGDGGPAMGTTRDGDLVVAVAVPAGPGGSDILVARLDPFDGTVLASITFGGSGEERAAGVALDASGRIIVAGTTTSADFPAAASGQGSGPARVFVCRIGPEMKKVEAAVSPMQGTAFALALAGDGSVYVGGSAAVPGVPGGENGFVLHLAPGSLETLDTLFIGGSGADRVKALAVNSRGEVVAAGDTESKEDFPFTENAWQPQINVDRSSGFVALLDSRLGRIIAATAVNAGRAEEIDAVNIGRNDSVVAAGATGSPDFPSTRGDHYHGGRDAFVIELSHDLTRLVGSRVFGGTGNDVGRCLVSEAGTFIVMAMESDSEVIDGIKVPLRNTGGRDIDLMFLGPSLKLLRPARAATAGEDHGPALTLGEGNRVIAAGITVSGGKASVYLSEHDLY